MAQHASLSTQRAICTGSSQLNSSDFFSIVCPDNAAHSNASPCLLTPPLFTTVVSVSLPSFFFRPCSCSVPTKKVTHGKAQEEAGLANAGISDEYKLEEVVVIPLPPGGLGRGGWGHRCLCYGLWFVGRSVASSVGYCWGVVGLLGLCEFSWLLFRKIMPSSCRHRVVVHRHARTHSCLHARTSAQSKSKTTAHGNDGETGICYAYLIFVQNSRRAK